MESSATRQRAINLGKKLVEALGREHGEDVMSRWMAHYIAEQMTVAETSKGAEKAIAEEKCFSAILSLWKHRASLPPGQRPFENFDAIFRALERLDPEDARGFYYGFWSGQEKPNPGSVEALVNLIMDVDAAARVLIELALVEAIEKATDDKTKSLLCEAIPTGADRDIEAIRNLVELRDRFAPTSGSESATLIKRIRDRLQTLDQFARACKGVRAELQKQLQRLETISKASPVLFEQSDAK